MALLFQGWTYKSNRKKDNTCIHVKNIQLYSRAQVTLTKHIVMMTTEGTKFVNCMTPWTRIVVLKNRRCKTMYKI